MTPVEAYKTCVFKNQRIKELESIILTNYYYCFYYALFVIKGRWPEAEPVILKSPEYSYVYARDIIKARWYNAEPVIIQHEIYWKLYCNYFNTKKEKCNWKIGL